MSSTLPVKKDFSCGGVVWDEPEKRLLIVLVENMAGHQVWTFPKGHPEANESDTEAALREVREETGWQCRVLRPITDVNYFYQRDGVRYQKVVRWFLMAPEKKVGEFAPEEILDCRWVDVSEVRQWIFYDSDKTLLRELGF